VKGHLFVGAEKSEEDWAEDVWGVKSLKVVEQHVKFQASAVAKGGGPVPKGRKRKGTGKKLTKKTHERYYPWGHYKGPGGPN